VKEIMGRNGAIAFILSIFGLISLSFCQNLPQIPSSYSVHVKSYQNLAGGITRYESYQYLNMNTMQYMEFCVNCSETPFNSTTISTRNTTTYILRFFDRYTCVTLPMTNSLEGMQIPLNSVYNGTSTIRGIQCDAWTSDMFPAGTEIWYIESGTSNPVRVVQEYIDYYESFDFYNFVPSAPSPNVFEIPKGQTCKDLAWADVTKELGYEFLEKSCGNRKKLQEQINSKERLERINKIATTWTAGANKRFEGMTLKDAQSLLGWKGPFSSLANKRNLNIKSRNAPMAVPSTFDARQQWPGCVGAVRNQEDCGSCWAFAATESLSDRFCIASNGKINVTLSPQWLVDCFTLEYGCAGGYLDTTWEEMVKVGVATDSCVPYEGSNDQCPSQCQDGSNIQIYKSSNAYTVFENGSNANVLAIQTEIFNNGPVEVGFWVFDDFFSYSGGVYELHGPGNSFVGGHAVKIIGWGTDSTSGTDYWLVQNSWGPDWGLNGHFMIRRGTDECSIEDQVATGIPLLNSFIEMN